MNPDLGGLDPIKTLSCHLPGGSEENHESPQNSQCPSQDLYRAHPECVKAGVHNPTSCRILKVVPVREDVGRSGGVGQLFFALPLDGAK
jgi:hypothetical protein